MRKIQLKLIYSLIFSVALFSCSDDLTIGSVDENQYNNVYKTDATLRDCNNGTINNIIELRAKGHQTSVNIKLSKRIPEGVNFNISYDEGCLDSYNKEHNTNFKLLPKELMTIGGKESLDILIAPNVTNSFSVNLNILPDKNKLVDGETYLLPLKLTSSNSNVSVNEKNQHCFYLIKNYINESDCNKGADAVKNFLFFEVNDTNPLNALEFVREDGKLLFDYVVIFAANINWNDETGRVYLKCNPNVQFLLDNHEKYIQPLRARGIKVLLCVLGNHDEAGVAQLSEMGAKEFAKELAVFCETYELDGVNFDDEYSNSPNLSNPWLAEHNKASASRLLYETKMAMPDKYVTVYYLGEMDYDCPDINGIGIGNYVDIAVADYPIQTGLGGQASPMNGMTRKQCAGMSVELRRGRGDVTTEYAQNMKEDGYGYFMWFALDPSLYGSQLYKIDNVSRGLYGQKLISPQFYYKKNDLTRYPLNN